MGRCLFLLSISDRPSCQLGKFHSIERALVLPARRGPPGPARPSGRARRRSRSQCRHGSRCCDRARPDFPLGAQVHARRMVCRHSHRCAWPAPFFLGLEGRIFPDLPAAALLLGCLLILEMPPRRPAHLLLLGALIGVSPWFHFKNALPFGTIAVITTIGDSTGPLIYATVSATSALLRTVLVSVIGYEASLHTWYGSWLPTRMFTPGNEILALSVPRGVAAAAFDAVGGVFTNNPALLLILAGLPIWARMWPGPSFRLGLAIGPTILLEATFNDWSGRLLPGGALRAAVQLPGLVPAIALLLLEVPVALRLLAGLILGLQLVLATTSSGCTPGGASQAPQARSSLRSTTGSGCRSTARCRPLTRMACW